MARIDYEKVGSSYDAARALALDGLDHWRRALAPLLPPNPRILDLGAGTGQFALAFALWFQARVFAVEPARAMRLAGIDKTRSLPVDYIAGDATSIPLRSVSCDAAWLSTVIHHIPDLDACARDLRRALRPSAPVLIRGAFPGRTDRITLFGFFPEAASVVETYPTVGATLSAFERAGFSNHSLEPVPQQSVATLTDFRARVALRADTTLKLIPDSAFEAGLRRLDAAIQRGDQDRPVVDYLDLLVLR